MTEEERNGEGLDESIEDLEAPAAALHDVAAAPRARLRLASKTARRPASRQI
jgi:hypothetical protein